MTKHTKKKTGKRARSVWVLGHKLSPEQYKKWQQDVADNTRRNPDWSAEFCKHRSLNNILYEQSPSSHMQERVKEAFDRLLNIGFALEACGKFPVYACNDRLRRTSVDALRQVTEELNSVGRDMSKLTQEIEAEIGTDRRVVA